MDALKSEIDVKRNILSSARSDDVVSSSSFDPCVPVGADVLLTYGTVEDIMKELKSTDERLQALKAKNTAAIEALNERGQQEVNETLEVKKAYQEKFRVLSDEIRQKIRANSEAHLAAAAAFNAKFDELIKM